MKRAIGQGAIVILAFILQNTVFSTLSFNGVKPNLLLIITVYFGFAASMNNGMLTGFFCGLLCDIFFASFIGVYSFFFVLLGAFSGVMARLFYQDDVIFPYLTIAVTDIVYGTVYYILMFLLRGRFVFTDYLKGIILPEVLYTLILALVLLPILHKCNAFFERLEIKEKMSDAS